MGLREKVAIVSLAVIFIQIAYTHCMPRSITSQLKSNRLKKILAYRPSTENTVTKNYQTTNSIINKNDKTKKAENKYSLNLLTKLIKEAKTQNGDSTNATIDPLSPYSKPFATTPQPFCYKELGTFPEVEYPMYVMDTWAPKYWKTLPTVQKTKGEPSNDCCEIKTSPESKYIKPSDKAIEKAISALIKLRSKGVNKVPKDNVGSPPKSTSSTSQDICPLDPPNQCLPTDKPGVSNTSTPTSVTTCIPPTNSAPVKDLCDTTTATPFIENDTNQLPTPTSTTSEYEYENAIPLTQAEPIIAPNNSPPVSDTASSTIVENTPVSGAISPVSQTMTSDETALPLTQAIPITSSSNSLPVPDTSLPTSVVDSTPVSPILPCDETALQAVPTEDTCDSNLLPTCDTSPDNNFGLSDYDFATMPPPDISYDTTIKNVNPDDMSTKFSPGDTDYILT